MIINLLLALISLVALITLHEFGHFILAKKFGIKVEEFGIGIPPRILGKKIGETIYSLNLIPVGAFVKLYGEEPAKRKKGPGSFSEKPIWQRALVILGGVLVFWIIAAVLLSVVYGMGVPTPISDEANVENPRVRIVAISPHSPLDKTSVKVGDALTKISVWGSHFPVEKVSEVQELSQKYKGERITLTFRRGDSTFKASLVPRVSPPKGEGPMGAALVRTATKSYPWYLAPIQGIKATGQLTLAAIQGWGWVLSNLIQGEGMPPGAQVRGPVGIFQLFTQMGALGASYFIRFVAIVSIFLALFNILPIPALDGGKLLFLGIEKIRGQPVDPKLEQKVTAVFFTLLIALIIFVSVKDIIRIL